MFIAADEKSKEKIKKVFEMYLHGYHIEKIAKELNMPESLVVAIIRNVMPMPILRFGKENVRRILNVLNEM